MAHTCRATRTEAIESRPSPENRTAPTVYRVLRDERACSASSAGPFVCSVRERKRARLRHRTFDQWVLRCAATHNAWFSSVNASHFSRSVESSSSRCCCKRRFVSASSLAASDARLFLARSTCPPLIRLTFAVDTVPIAVSRGFTSLKGDLEGRASDAVSSTIAFAMTSAKGFSIMLDLRGRVAPVISNDEIGTVAFVLRGRLHESYPSCALSRIWPIGFVSN